MGKRAITTTEEKPIQKTGDKATGNAKENVAAKTPASATPKSSEQASSKKRLDTGILYVQSTYNNTKLLLTDTKGNAIAASSAGALGFKGAKKGTPFAAAKVGETLAAKVQPMGLKEVSVIVKGTGSGRESSIRGFTSKGIMLSSIKDATPVPFNGPKAKRARRV